MTSGDGGHGVDGGDTGLQHFFGVDSLAWVDGLTLDVQEFFSEDGGSLVDGGSRTVEGPSQHLLGYGHLHGLSCELAVGNGPGLEADVIASRAFDAGPILRYNFGRNGSNIGNPQIKALPDIDGGIELGGYAQLNFPVGGFKTFVAPRISVVQGVSGGASGTVVEGSLGLTRLQDDWVFGARVSATYANDTYMNAQFGVGAASPSGLAAFNASAGIKDVGVSVFANYKINDRVSATGVAGYKRLTGDAANSPIVTVAGNKNQAFLALGLSYTFD